MTIRPRRSVLYMPGSNARAMDKAKTLPVDGVILDLEAAIAAKPDAILVPKISTPDQIEMIGTRMLDTHTDHHVRLWAMIETPAAIFNIREIAAEARDSESRLAGFVIGT